MLELEKLSGVELGKLVNSKQISPVEIMEYTERRIEERNESINAVVYTKFDEAKIEARRLEHRIMRGENVGPLAGVPIGLKDFLPTKVGWPATHGGVKSLVTIDDANSEFYKAARSLGAIAVGKTNAPSFGFRATTDNYLYGPTSTPFDARYNSGGSSGGSASAVADGLLHLAEGGDAGGSIRVPAAWCGCFGFKPSAGLVPSVCRPDAWTATHPYCCGGPITRTVEDAAVMLTQMMKYDMRDPISVPLRRRRFEVAAKRSVQDLRIGVTYDLGVFPHPEAPIVRAVDLAAQVLKFAGAHVEYIDFEPLKYSREEVEDAWLTGICVDTAIDLELWKKGGFDFEAECFTEVPNEFFKYCRKASETTIMDYRKFHDVRTAVLDQQLDVFRNYDIIIAPVTGCLPVLNTADHNTKGPEYIGEEKVDPLIGFAYTYLENMTGFPAASVPVGLSEEGLPLAVQVIGNRYQDDKVFAVSGALEYHHPWKHIYDKSFNRDIKEGEAEVK